MKKQLEYVYEKQFTKEDGLKKDLLGVGVALDASLKEAKIGARAAAVQEIVNQVMKPMKSIISKNGGIQENDTLSVAERLRVVEEKCKQKMMSGPVLADVYKQERGKYKVKRYCSYSYKDARNMAIEFFEADLQNESERLKKALRNSANWD
ncbi:MAG: hypothetical protein K5860_02065 [Bacteroidales bacterium]|nr:hypothetical protein [Bacteroidales bacterium]